MKQFYNRLNSHFFLVPETRISHTSKPTAKEKANSQHAPQTDMNIARSCAKLTLSITVSQVERAPGTHREQSQSATMYKELFHMLESTRRTLLGVYRPVR